MSVPLLHQIEELERELVFRRDVYPRQVARKKMRQGEATLHTARMEAALKTLRWLQGRDIPPGMARPADMIAALVHLRERARAGVSADEAVKIIEDVLAGIPLPKLEERKAP